MTCNTCTNAGTAMLKVGDIIEWYCISFFPVALYLFIKYNTICWIALHVYVFFPQDIDCVHCTSLFSHGMTLILTS